MSFFGDSMQINRLFGIVYILLEKKCVTANELASHFEVSKRTILRDIEALTMAGIPIYTSRGKGGGIKILDNFILNKAVISEEEQNQILIALQSLASTSRLETGDTFTKLSSLFEKTDANWIEVDFSRWGSQVPDKQKFEQLRTAVTEQRRLAFRYSSTYGESTDREVYPLKLVFKANAWYLQAYCLSKEDYRIFKVNRMFEIEVMPECFSGQKLLPPPLEQTDTPEERLVHLKLQFSPDAAYRLYDEFSIDHIRRCEDGTFIVIADLAEDSWLYGFLLSFGPAVRVLEPQAVKDRLLAQVEEIKKINL